MWKVKSLKDALLLVAGLFLLAVFLVAGSLIKLLQKLGVVKDEPLGDYGLVDR